MPRPHVGAQCVCGDSQDEETLLVLLGDDLDYVRHGDDVRCGDSQSVPRDGGDPLDVEAGDEFLDQGLQAKGFPMTLQGPVGPPTTAEEGV